MIRLLCFLLAATVDAKVKPVAPKTGASAQKTGSTAPNTGAKTEDTPPQADSPRTAPHAATGTPGATQAVLSPAGNILELFTLVYVAIQAVVPETTSVFSPVKDAIGGAPDVAYQAYEQVATAVSTHSPTLKTMSSEALGACEVYVAEARNLGEAVYRENVGPHLDPQIAVVREVYDMHVSPHVDTAFKAYADAYPMMAQQAGDAYTATKGLVGEKYEQLNEEVFKNVLPAAKLNAEHAVASVAEHASIIFEPIDVKVGDKTLVFPLGIFDIVGVAFISTISAFMFLAIFTFVLRRSLRLVGKTLSSTLYLVKSLISLTYFVVVRLIFGLVFLALRIVTLNYLCKCCGLCAKRKLPKAAKTAKSNVTNGTSNGTSNGTNGHSNGTSNGTSNGNSKKTTESKATSKKGDSPAPTSASPERKKKDKKK